MAKTSVAGRARFVLTDSGKAAAEADDECQCCLALVGRFLECRLCGTVYGEMFAASLPLPNVGKPL